MPRTRIQMSEPSFPKGQKEFSLSYDEILNQGFSLALEWGQSWLEPIQERLANIYPHLTPVELDYYNSLCQEVARYGNDLIYKIGLDPFKNNWKCCQLWKVAMLDKYSWVNEENLGRSFSQSCYYALK